MFKINQRLQSKWSVLHGVTDSIVVPEEWQPPVPPSPLAAFVRDPGETGCQKPAFPGAEPTTAQHSTVTLPTLWINYITYWSLCKTTFEPQTKPQGFVYEMMTIVFVLFNFPLRNKDSLSRAEKPDWDLTSTQVESRYTFSSATSQEMIIF